MKRVRVPVAAMLEKSNQGEEHFGLRCSRCKCLQFGDGKKVRNTRPEASGIRRYRVCRNCGHVWATHER